MKKGKISNARSAALGNDSLLKNKVMSKEMILVNLESLIADPIPLHCKRKVSSKTSLKNLLNYEKEGDLCKHTPN